MQSLEKRLVDTLGTGVSTVFQCFNGSISVLKVEEFNCSSGWETYPCEAGAWNSSSPLWENDGSSACSGTQLEAGNVVGFKYRICSAIIDDSNLWKSLCSQSRRSFPQLLQAVLRLAKQVRLWMKAALMLLSTAATALTLGLYAVFGCGGQDRNKIFINSMLALLIGYVVEAISMYNAIMEPDFSPNSNTWCKLLEVLKMYSNFSFLHWAVVQGHFLYARSRNLAEFPFPYWRYLIFAWGASIIQPAIWLHAVEYGNGGHCWGLKFKTHMYLLGMVSGSLVATNFYYILKSDSKTAQWKKILSPSGAGRCVAVLLKQFPFTGLETVLLILATTDVNNAYIETSFELWFALQGILFCICYCWTSTYLKGKLGPYASHWKSCQVLPRMRRTNISSRAVGDCRPTRIEPGQGNYWNIELGLMSGSGRIVVGQGKQEA